MQTKRGRGRPWARAMVWLVASGVAAQAAAFEPYEQELQRQVRELGERLRAAGRTSAAVVDFTDLEGNVTQLGRFLAEELSVGLANGNTGLEIVDRTHLAALLREHKLSADGLVDPENARKLGRVAGVQVLITGSLTAFGESVRVSAKALDSATAKMIASSSVNIAKTGVIQSLFAAGIGTGPSATKGPQQASRGDGSPGGTAARPPTGAAGARAAEPPRQQEVAPFLFELHRCELAGQTATCLLYVANRAPTNRCLHIANHTRLTDDQGNDYSVSQVAIANAARDFRQSHWALEKIMVPNYPVKVTAVFEGIAPEATRVAELALLVGQCDQKNTVAAFRDVSLTTATAGSSPSLGQLAEQLGDGTTALPGAEANNGPSAPAPDPVKDAAKGLAGQVFKKLGRNLFGGGSPAPNEQKPQR